MNFCCFVIFGFGFAVAVVELRIWTNLWRINTFPHRRLGQSELHIYVLLVYNISWKYPVLNECIANIHVVPPLNFLKFSQFLLKNHMVPPMNFWEISQFLLKKSYGTSYKFLEIFSVFAQIIWYPLGILKIMSN